MLKIFFLFFLLSANLALADELKIVTAESFVAANPSPERKAIIDFLVKQFESKKEIGVTQAMLDELWANKKLRETYMMARFQIIDQKVYAQSFYLGHYYFQILLKYFGNLVQNYKIPDIDFIIYLREEIPMKEALGEKTLGIPAFIMFQDLNSSYETDKLLFPDAFFMKDNKNGSYSKLIKKIELANMSNPWSNKLNKIFWRGTTTGDFYNYTVKNFDKLPRLTISVLSKLYPDLIDAAFSSYSAQISWEHHGHNLMEFSQILFGKASKAKEEDHLKYKYLLSLDGNAATGTRVPWIMFSNSALVKQESQKIQWFYSALKPYVNYVPINHILTDLFQQIEWMKNHDEELQKISANAQNFVQNNLRPEHIDSHIIILLNEYAKIQKDQKIIPTLTKAEDVISISSVAGMFFYRFKKYLIERTETWF